MYDYIIVGAGSAGCVLASRLTEDPQTRVLLLEAGGSDAVREMHIPAAFSKLFRGPSDWAYETDPEPNTAGRRMYWPRGKTLGGSSSMNAMLYIRGHASDYDAWAAAGCRGWGWTDVLPYFRKSEHNERGASEYHGDGGPLNVADQRDPNPVSLACVEALVSQGITRNADFNGAEQAGAGLYQVTQRHGARCSAADAFLHPAMRRSNLTVRIGAHVTRVLFDGRRARGVAFLANGKPEQAPTAREVILCGGAINSPQLLLLSGVGPADALKTLGIPLVAHLPGVGENLQDHLATGVVYSCSQPCTLASADSLTNVARYLVTRRGPLTSCVAEAGAFVRTRSDLPASDLQLVFAPTYFINHGFEKIEGHGFTFGVTLLRPRSRGRITLRSASPVEPPAIRANYLAEPSDLETLIEGVRMFREVAAAAALDPYRGTEVMPGPGVVDRAEVAAVIARRSETLYHPVGTCKMGHDDTAVVDDRLRVHGVAGLRVVDASIMPTIVGGNTNAPTIMIAERASEMLIDDHLRAKQATYHPDESSSAAAAA